MPSWTSSDSRIISGRIEYFCKCDRRLTVQTAKTRKNPVNVGRRVESYKVKAEINGKFAIQMVCKWYANARKMQMVSKCKQGCKWYAKGDASAFDPNLGDASAFDPNSLAFDPDALAFDPYALAFDPNVQVLKEDDSSVLCKSELLPESELLSEFELLSEMIIMISAM
ncbi:hypothetical protein Tco_1159379 [Tanacetum coccineum]